MRPSALRAEPHRQRHVGALGFQTRVECRRLKHRLARVERVGHARLKSVDGLPEGFLFLIRQRARACSSAPTRGPSCRAPTTRTASIAARSPAPAISASNSVSSVGEIVRHDVHAPQMTVTVQPHERMTTPLHMSSRALCPGSRLRQIPGVANLHWTRNGGLRGGMDPGDKPRDDSILRLPTAARQRGVATGCQRKLLRRFRPARGTRVGSAQASSRFLLRVALLDRRCGSLRGLIDQHLERRPDR